MTSTPTVLATARGPIEYVDEGAGAAVLVLHGSPGGIDAAELMSLFLPRTMFRVITVSRPGYLGTELGARRSPDEQAALYVALLDALGIERVGVLAWSGGGPSAFRLAASHPERVTALVAAACVSGHSVEVPDDAEFTTGSRVGALAAKLLLTWMPEQLVRRAINAEGLLTPDEVDERVAFVFADAGRRRFATKIGATSTRFGSRKPGWYNDCLQFGEIDSLGLSSITVPTLLVHGSADVDVDPAHSMNAHSAIDGSELVVLDRGSHLAFFTHPDSVAVQAEAFVLLGRS